MYADPIDPRDRTYFDIASIGQHERATDLRHLQTDFRALVDTVIADYESHIGRRPTRILLVGRWHRAYSSVMPSDVHLDYAGDNTADEVSLVTDPLADSLGEAIERADIILLHEHLEGVHSPDRVLEGLSKALRTDQLVAVAFANMRSLPSRVLRRRWKSFFDRKIAFYDGDNLDVAMWRSGFQRILQRRLRTTYSLGYCAARLGLSPGIQRAFRRSGLARLSAHVASGYEVVLFNSVPVNRSERLSVIVPVYNEERYVGDVLDALLAKELPIEKEVVIVESDSSDSSREIVRSFEGRSGVKIILQDRAQGKGSAVREALAATTGTIVLIQDADFEYDLDDYDALLEPIIQRRSSFVLGSRSLGLDDWKVRTYASSPVKSFLMNFAQVVFARSFNLLYQQKVTDINTMLKVFRSECLDGVHLQGNGFNLDIELVCKIVRNGYDPLEIPVNYVARSFEEGKKINFLFDAYPSYYQLLRCRFGAI